MKTNTDTAWIRSWGGVCQGMNPEDVPPGIFLNALDMEVDRIGALIPRKGAEPISTATPDAKAIRSMFVADWDGSDRVFAATSHHVYEWVAASDTWTLIYTIANTTAKRVLFDILNAATTPTLVFGNGKDPLQKWTGTGSSSACTNAPAGRPVVYKNYIACFDIDGKPGRVQFSTSPGDPDAWVVNGVTRYLEMRGRVTGVFPFVGLVIFTADRAELFSGDPDQALGVQTLSESDGCVSYETIADVNGVLFWLSRAGVMSWNGGGAFPSRNMSDPAEEGVVSSIRVDMGKLAWDQIAGASAVYDSVNQRYLLSAQLQSAIGSAAYWRTFVYDIAHAGWWPWSLQASALGVFRYAAAQQPVVISANGTCIRQQKSIAFADVDRDGNATEYEYNATSGYWDAENPNASKIFRRIIVNASSGYGDQLGGTRTIQFRIRGEFDRIYSGDASITSSVGGFILGVNVLGDRLYETNANESSAPMALRSKHFQFVLFGAGADNAAAVASLGVAFRLDTERPITVR